MNKTEKVLLEALIKIRDSTFRDAASLRAIADYAVNNYKADKGLTNK